MKPKENILEYYREDLPQLLDEFKEFCSEWVLEYFKCEHLSLRDITIIEDKPDEIPQHLWDELFYNSSEFIDSVQEFYFGDSLVQYIMIEDYKVGFFNDIPTAIFCYRSSVSQEHSTNHLIESHKERYLSATTHGAIENENVQTFYNACVEMFGHENVWAGRFKGNPGLTRLRNLSNNSFYVIVKHEPFWCYDSFGLGFKIPKSVSSFHFRSSGGVGNSFIKFGAYLRDRLAFEKEMAHPHVRSVSTSTYVYMRTVCRGSGSPINSAISAWSENPTDETSYNLLLNYMNLLSREDEEGTPYRRQRSYFLQRSNNSSGRSLSINEIKDFILDDSIKIDADITDKSITLEYDQQSIDDLLESLSEGGESIFYCVKDGRAYKKKLHSSRGTGSTKTSFIWYDQLEPIGYVGHDPDNFDISGISGDHRRWNAISVSMPDSYKMEALKSELEAIVNNKLIKESNAKRIQSQELKHELIGIKEVGRTADPEDFPELAEAN